MKERQNIIMSVLHSFIFNLTTKKNECAESHWTEKNHDRHVVINVDVKQDVVKIEEFEGN